MMNLFYTRSTNLCAYLMMNNHKVKAKQRDSRGTIFYFERSQELNESIEQYNNDEKIKKFISCFKDVKEIMKND
jgi:hypothetical protein